MGNSLNRVAEGSRGCKVGWIAIDCLCGVSIDVCVVEEHPTSILEYVGSPPCSTSSKSPTVCKDAKRKVVV